MVTRKWVDTGGSERFQYQDLDHTKKEIRLFHIDMRRDDKRSFGDLKHCDFDLNTIPKYRALSYTWGPPYPSFDLPLNSKGAYLSIRRNLLEFLQIYKDRHYGEWIWIDQLCINQDTTKERNHQVKQMEEIYRGALEVIVWIGPDPFDGEAARLINSCDKLSKHSPREDFALFNFFSANYWSRLWVVQEMRLAKSITIYYGSSIIRWDDLQKFNDLGFHEKLRSVSLIGILILNGEPMSSHPLGMLTNFCDSECVDARDKIYGMQSLFREGYKLEVDYKQSPKTVFINAAVTYLPYHGSPWTMGILERLMKAMRLRLTGVNQPGLLDTLLKQYHSTAQSQGSNKEEAIGILHEQLIE